MTINRFCSSGLQAIVDRRRSHRRAAPSTSASPAASSRCRWSRWAATSSSLNPTRGRELPRRLHPDGHHRRERRAQVRVSRADQDAFALREPPEGGRRAWARGDFAAEIVPVADARLRRTSAWRDVTVDRDEGPRADTTLEKLAALKPAFDPDRHGHRRQRSPLTDGAAAVVLMAGRQGARGWA